MTYVVEALAAHHDLEDFASEASELNLWLTSSARQSNDRDTARVYVICNANARVIAYSALVVGTISRETLRSRAASGLPQHVPAILLAKLAVDRSYLSSGLGTQLLSHAIRISLEVKERVAVRLLFAEARDQVAHDWYVSRGMSSAKDGRTCYARLKDFA